MYASNIIRDSVIDKNFTVKLLDEDPRNLRTMFFFQEIFPISFN